MNRPGSPGNRSFVGCLAPGSRVTTSVDSNELSPRPLGDRVLVRQDKPSEKTAGGLFRPDVAGKDWPPVGTVIAVGSKNKDVRAGDRVLFKRRPGSALVQDDRIPDQEHWKHLVMLHAEDILGIVEG